MNERPISNVPGAVLAALGMALLLQVGLRSSEGIPESRVSDLGAVPTESTLRLAAFGDPAPLARLLMLYLQSFDSRADNEIRYQAMDYEKLTTWLSRILDLDSSAQYPLHAASRIYAEVPDPVRQRRILEFVYTEFFRTLKSAGPGWRTPHTSPSMN
jgi:hypothetical protein